MRCCDELIGFNCHVGLCYVEQHWVLPVLQPLDVWAVMATTLLAAARRYLLLAVLLRYVYALITYSSWVALTSAELVGELWLLFRL